MFLPPLAVSLRDCLQTVCGNQVDIFCSLVCVRQLVCYFNSTRQGSRQHVSITLYCSGSILTYLLVHTFISKSANVQFETHRMSVDLHLSLIFQIFSKKGCEEVNAGILLTYSPSSYSKDIVKLSVRIKTPQKAAC